MMMKGGEQNDEEQKQEKSSESPSVQASSPPLLGNAMHHGKCVCVCVCVYLCVCGGERLHQLLAVLVFVVHDAFQAKTGEVLEDEVVILGDAVCVELDEVGVDGGVRIRHG